jgi:phenylacetate-coenzyme A ligase PaaK-like adenylate-forming protein
MKNIGMMKALKLCRDYQKLDIGHREALRRQRLEEVVHWAKEMSPYYARLYKEIADDFTLTDLPAVNKRNLMANWDEWITDRRLTLTDVNSFMESLDNVGRKLNDKYLVFTTSGSSGNPLVCLCDKTTNNIMGAVNALRAFARKEDLKAFIARKGKTMGVFATGGFYLSNSSVRARLLAMPWKKRQMAVTSALLPITEVVKQLNDFQPAMLGGYPSHLELLIDEAKSGRLHISPLIIMTGGEYLPDTLRTQLSEVFGCYVQTSYSCTEGGTIACECRERHFHINDDWLIVEPVDNDNHPVPDGMQSDKILLTNLYNYTQPFIRYEVSDRVILHREPCKCGNPSPWLELEGRTDDVVSFMQGDRKIRIAPL